MATKEKTPISAHAKTQRLIESLASSSAFSSQLQLSLAAPKPAIKALEKRHDLFLRICCILGSRSVQSDSKILSDMADAGYCLFSIEKKSLNGEFELSDLHQIKNQ